MTITNTEASDPIAEAITDYWGDRCADYSEGCPCCDAWAQYDALSHPSSSVSAEVTERKGIYVASKVAHAEMWKDLRNFEQLPIISTWIDEAGVGESASLEDLWRRCVHEASNAGALIIYRRHDEVLKGAWVELGAALASGVPVFAVGIEEFTVANHAGIMHCANLIEARKAALAALNGKE